ncbi:hypothetical protein FQN54_003188 [Arachnomyces sp. PD_36]|nr:hypothetical protein FQN54_003188 [Arachnomyces sp. PD_36]
MRRLSLQGARWHQHAVRKGLLNRAPYFKQPPLLQPLHRSFSAYGRRYRKEEDDYDVEIHHYEQASRHSKKRVEIDPGAELAEQDAVKAKLDELERELEVLKEGPYGPNSPFMKSLSEEDREIALKALREHREERERQGIKTPTYEDEDIIDEELDDMIDKEFKDLDKEEEEDWDPTKPVEEDRPPPPKLPYEVELKVQDTHQAYVNQFNNCLKHLGDGSSRATTRQELWKWYRRCKQAIPQFANMMPDETFTILWDSQFQGKHSAASRASEMETLVDDMISGGKTLTGDQWLTYAKILHQADKTDEALEIWTTHKDALMTNQEDKERYWKLGVQLFAAEGDPKRAEEIALTLLSRNKSQCPRVLIPVMTAWAKLPAPNSADRAWALYLRLKALLRSNMTMKDYDAISIDFLKSGHTGLALAVFKDMMLTGQKSSNDSTDLYRASLGLVGDLHASSISEAEVNKVSLSALTILPRRFQNKFFYASWMKKLIGMGEVDSAAMVVELMYERGVKPDTKHLNGIIAGWFRAGSPTARAKAEKLAWSMVQERIDKVWTLYSNSETSKPTVPSGDRDVRIPKFMRREVPQANIETFSILLLYYSRRSQDDLVTYLIECLDNARIRPNSYFLTHTLYRELRKQNIGAVWQKYNQMKGIAHPDLETFAALWDTGKLQYDRSRIVFDHDFPSARALYHEMMDWFSSMRPHGQRIAREEFSKEIYDQITRCFCLSKDLHGTLVALFAMRDTFGIYPDADTARMLVLQVARLTPVPAGVPKHRRRRLSTTPRSKENISHIERLLEILHERKVMALAEEDRKLEDLEEGEQRVFQLELLSDLLRVVLQRMAPSAHRVEERIQTATQEMGVEGIYVGPPVEDEL